MYYKAKIDIISISNMGYTRQAIKGISWMSLFRIISRILAFFKIAVLARVLTPSQFGVFGIASIVLAFLEIITETGINIILIQAKKETKGYLDSAWVVSIARGIIISFGIIILSPLISSFFKTPDAFGILLLISLVPLIKGFINPAEIQFRKKLNFKYEFWFRTILFLVDAMVAVIFALITQSVYSLVIGLLAGAVLEVILSFALIKPTPKLILNRNYLRDILHKGKWITAYGIFNYLSENGDNIFVGKMLGSSSLGIYQMAYKLSILPISEVSDVVSQVVFPVYSKIEEDTKRLLKAYFKTMVLTILGGVAVGGIIFLYPKEIVTIILGSQWLSVVPVLKVLSIYGIFRTISGPSSALFLAKGKQNYVTLMNFTRFSAILITIFPLILIYGITGAGYSVLIGVLIELPIIILFIFKIFKSINK